MMIMTISLTVSQILMMAILLLYSLGLSKEIFSPCSGEFCINPMATIIIMMNFALIFLSLIKDLELF